MQLQIAAATWRIQWRFPLLPVLLWSLLCAYCPR